MTFLLLNGCIVFVLTYLANCDFGHIIANFELFTKCSLTKFDN